jgi:hypothetical protein
MKTVSGAHESSKRNTTVATINLQTQAIETSKLRSKQPANKKTACWSLDLGTLGLCVVNLDARFLKAARCPTNDNTQQLKTSLADEWGGAIKTAPATLTNTDQGGLDSREISNRWAESG